MQLAAQGLLGARRHVARPDDLVAAVQRMGMLQIDSIHVIARSQYLVLHARVGDYPETWLDELLARGRLAECWAHEACLVTAGDVAWHRAWSLQRGRHWAHRHAWAERQVHRAAMDRVLARIRAEGPLAAADFTSARSPQGAGWWAWKPEKRWLEAWFALGELMVVRRERFQRVYDLAERVLAQMDPPLAEGAVPTDPQAVRRRFVLDAVRALGVAQARWIADYHRLRPGVSAAELAPLLAAGELVEVQVADWTEPAYVHRDHAVLLERARRGRLRATRTELLSPFDPLVWDRARLEQMFDFRYALECYVPAHRRKHGYYVLPILHRGRMIGRMDAKAERVTGTFLVRALYLEDGVVPEARMAREVADAIAGLARWHGTPRVVVERTQPEQFAGALRRQFGDPGSGSTMNR